MNVAYTDLQSKSANLESDQLKQYCSSWYLSLDADLY